MAVEEHTEKVEVSEEDDDLGDDGVTAIERA